MAEPTAHEIARAAVAAFARREPLLWRAGDAVWRPRFDDEKLILRDRSSDDTGWWCFEGLLKHEDARKYWTNDAAAERAAKQYDEMMEDHGE